MGTARCYDPEEHVAWIAVQLSRKSDVDALLALTSQDAEPNFTPMRVQQHDGLALAVQAHPMCTAENGASTRGTPLRASDYWHGVGGSLAESGCSARWAHNRADGHR